MRLPALVLVLAASAAAVPPAGEALADADLRALLGRVKRAEDAYRAAHGRYTASVTALGIERPDGVDLRITAEGAAGFAAVATSAEAECAVVHGRARAPRSYARTAGRIACRAR